MSDANALVRLEGGPTMTLRAGDVIGRGFSVALRIDDPRVSEAHALVSLRGNELRLLSLRGELLVDGEVDDDIPLHAGLKVDVAGAVTLEVVGVAIPRVALALSWDGSPPRELWAGSYSLVAEPELALDLVPGLASGALAHVWSAAERWMLQVGDEQPVAIRPGRSWELGGVRVRAVRVRVDGGLTSTQGSGSGLVVVARGSGAHLRTGRRLPVFLDGQPGRVVSELAVMSCPAPWKALASELWPDEADRHLLRRRLDRVLERLRAKLREAGVREDLVRYDGTGNLELVLLPQDRVEDDA